MQNRRFTRLLWLAVILILSLSCAIETGSTPTAAPIVIPPTAMPQPTAVPPTAVPPTATTVPTITPTPGPVSVKDDFSSKNTELWPTDCIHCEWNGGQLLLGPYEPGTNLRNSLNYIICEGCGEHSSFRVSVDAIFVDGQVDRYFGLIAPLFREADGTVKSLYYLGMSPWQFLTIREYNFVKDLTNNVVTKTSGAVKPGKTVNHLEIVVKQASQNGMVDISFNMNGQSVGILYSQPAKSAWVALGMSYHSVTVAYDNFEYEELP
jgi:hypothetical protein